MIHVGSLFSGIGGIELGLERTGGFKTIWFIENNEYCQQVLRKHWPSIPIYGDIKQIDFTCLQRPDMLTGGFPCQPVSIAGKKKGTQDERWLWPEYARAIRQIRPRLILVENVPGLYQRGFGTVLGDLASLGYDAEWDCLRASDIGAPHKRERIFIVAYSCESGFRTPIAHIFPRQPNFEGSIDSNSYANGCDNQRSQNQAQTSEGDARTQTERIPHRVSTSDTDSDRCEGTNLHLRPRKQAETTTKLHGNPEIAHNDRERIPRIFKGEISRVKDFSWCENVRRVEDLRGRPDIPEPLFCGGHNGVPDWMDRIASLGNAVVSQVAEWIGKQLLRVLNSKEEVS